MARFLLTRFALSLVTLFLLSVLVFATAQLLPGDIGRNVLGNLASEEDVERFNKMVGVDRPVWEQYWDWISDFVRGDLGTSLQYQVPVADLLGPSLVNSLKLAAVAFVLVVPLSCGGTGSQTARSR
jgi:peptide/nickel transport system permease protein